MPYKVGDIVAFKNSNSTFKIVKVYTVGLVKYYDVICVQNNCEYYQERLRNAFLVKRIPNKGYLPNWF